MSGRVSWSKNGFIAYSGTGNSIHLTYLENINGREWQLAPPQKFKITGHDGSVAAAPLLVVSWSNLSTDLAVCDHQGSFYVLLAGVGVIDHDTNGAHNGALNGQRNGNANIALQKPSTAYELTSYNQLVVTYRDMVGERNEVMALKWLNVEKNQIIPKPAVLVQTANESSAAYQYGVSLHQPLGLSHPISSKQACVVLRRNGELTLYYQGEHKVDYYKVSTKLEGTYITHGSLGLTKDKSLVVVSHNGLTGKISMHTIRIDWGFLAESASKQKTDPHYNTPEASKNPPVLLVEHCYDMLPQPIVVDATNEQQDGYTLLSIDLISPSPSSESNLDIFISYKSGNTTHFYQYEVGYAADVISPEFAELGRKKGIQGNQKTCPKLILVSRAVRPGLLLCVLVAFSDIFVVFNYDDGRVDIMDRRKMAIIDTTKAEMPPQTVSSIFDAGFSFQTPSDKNIIPGMIAYSPTLTARVYAFPGEDSPSLHLQTVSKLDSVVNPKALFITSVGAAFCHSYACYSNICADDFIVMVQQEILRVTKALRKTHQEKPHHIEVVVTKFIESIICESHKAINFQLDAFGKESVDKLLSNPPLQKLLSLQMVLGELQDHGRLISDLAWIVLNLRSTSFGIMFLLSSIYRQVLKKKPSEDTMQDSVARAECIVSLIGSVRWLIDLIIYLNQEFNQLANSTGDPAVSKLTMKNSIVLPIVLSKVPRLFLMYALSSIQKTHETLKKLHKDLSESNKLFQPMKEALNRYFTTCANSPLHISLFESFLREADAVIAKETSQNPKFEKKGFQLRVEQKLVFQGEISEEYIPIATAVVGKYANNISLDMKVSELFFYDVDWIGVGIQWFNDECAFVEGSHEVLRQYPQKPKQMVPRLAYGSKECIDALRKVVIPRVRGGAKVRKCTRCRSVSLVNDPLVFNAPTTLGLWTMVFQRSCICGSIWINTE